MVEPTASRWKRREDATAAGACRGIAPTGANGIVGGSPEVDIRTSQAAGSAPAVPRLVRQSAGTNPAFPSNLSKIDGLPGAGGGGRTLMLSEERGILSPVRLPVPPLQQLDGSYEFTNTRAGRTVVVFVLVDKHSRGNVR